MERMESTETKTGENVSIQKIVTQKKLLTKWADKSVTRDKCQSREKIDLEVRLNSIKNGELHEHQLLLSPDQIELNADKPKRKPIREIVSNFLQRVLTASKNVYIDPFGKVYYIWLLITSISYMYNVVFLIARAAFWLLDYTPGQTLVWSILDYALSDFIYACDIIVKFFTGYMEHGLMCFEHIKIAKRYIRTFDFKVDLLSLLPTDLIYYLYLKPRLRLGREFLSALRLNRLVKFSRFIEFRNTTETETKYPTAFRMTALLINILLAMHWNACVYFIISRWTGFGHDEWVFPSITTVNDTIGKNNNLLITSELDTQYIYCFWWSVQTLTTVAEVPPPKTPMQELYMSVLLMMGVVLLAITIGSAGDMVENANREKLDLQDKCDSAKSFLKQNKIGGLLEQRIKNYLDYLWVAKDVRSSNVLNTLPVNLRKEIAMNVHMETLKRVHVFQDCEPGLLEELVTKLTLQIYSPGDYVCRKGDVGHEMYFIKTGSLQVVSPDGTKVFATLVAGAAFGEISILDIPGNKNGNKRTANIRSLGFSDVFQLSKDDLWAALSEYPVAKKSLLEKGKALLKKDNLLDLELAEKIERDQKPIHEQVREFKTARLERVSQRLDEILKHHNEVIKENKILLLEMEKNIFKD